MRIEEFNALTMQGAADALFRCCHSPQWVSAMMQDRPYASKEAMIQAAESHWTKSNYRDVMAAFAGHPKIGDKNSLAKKFESTAEWSAKEQSGVDNADSEILDKLIKQNIAYERQFGYIFIVCATGKSAEEILSILDRRLENNPVEEYDIAKAEQGKITKLRLEKLLS